MMFWHLVVKILEGNKKMVNESKDLLWKHIQAMLRHANLQPERIQKRDVDELSAFLRFVRPRYFRSCWRALKGRRSDRNNENSTSSEETWASCFRFPALPQEWDTVLCMSKPRPVKSCWMGGLLAGWYRRDMATATVFLQAEFSHCTYGDWLLHNPDFPGFPLSQLLWFTQLCSLLFWGRWSQIRREFEDGPYIVNQNSHGLGWIGH